VGQLLLSKKYGMLAEKMVEALEIKNDFKNTLDDSIKPNKNIASLTREELVNMMKNSGLVGLGGAGISNVI